jgi:hypothetical protein
MDTEIYDLIEKIDSVLATKDCDKFREEFEKIKQEKRFDSKNVDREIRKIISEKSTALNGRLWKCKNIVPLCKPCVRKNTMTEYKMMSDWKTCSNTAPNSNHKTVDDFLRKITDLKESLGKKITQIYEKKNIIEENDDICDDTQLYEQYGEIIALYNGNSHLCRYFDKIYALTDKLNKVYSLCEELSDCSKSKNCVSETQRAKLKCTDFLPINFFIDY